MGHEIEVSEDAERQLGELTARERKTVLDAIETQLTWEPDSPTRSRKLLRSNPLAAWELRVGEFRVFYNVTTEAVIVVALGRKKHNRLFLDDKEYSL
jgi:mRNA interferase RelE/StbE